MGVHRIDDIVVAINELLTVSSAILVDTNEACRRLRIGRHQLDELVAKGRVKRIPNLKGKGGSHMYAVAELERFAGTGVLA